MKTTFRILCLLLIAALLLGAAPGADDAGWHYDEDFAADGLGGTLERYLAEKGLGERNLTIGWRDIESGEEWYLGADVFSEGASTYKLPLAMLYADWVDEGLLTREDKVGAYTVDEAVREARLSAFRLGISNVFFWQGGVCLQRTSSFFGRAEDYLRANVGGKHVLGLLSANTVGGTNRSEE